MLLASPSAIANKTAPHADTASTAQAAPPANLLNDAMLAMHREWQEKAGADAQLLQLLRNFPDNWSATTKAKLVTVFGTSEPLSVVRTQPAPGKEHFAVRQSGVNVAAPNGQHYLFSPLLATFETSDKGRQLTASGYWKMLNITIGADNLLLLGLDHASVQRQASNGNWYGTSRNRMGLAQIAIAGSPTLRLEEIRFDTHHLRGKQFDELRYTGGVHKTSMAGVEIDDIRFGMRIVKFDGNGYAALKKNMARLQSQAGNGAQQATAMLQHVQQFTMETINAGAAIVIDELGASYRGHRASLKGQIGFNTLSERDMVRSESVTDKLNLRFDIRLPLPLIQEISQAVGRHLGRSDARQIGDQLVSKLVADGYASIVKHELRTTMRLEQKKLSFNGKFFSQLTPPAKPSDAAAAAEERIISPIKIAQRCPPFIYPADAPKSYATASFQVGNDGQARWASMVDSSGSAALDAAILTSVSACAWMPATYRGAAIAVTQLETFGDDPRARPAMP